MVTHSSILVWVISMDRGAWRVAVYSVAKSDTTEHNTHTHKLTQTYTHAHTCTHTHTDSHTQTHTCTHTHTHSHRLTYTHTHAHTLTHLHTHSHALTPTQTHTHTLTHAHTLTHTLTCTQTHTHTHMHTHTQGVVNQRHSAVQWVSSTDFYMFVYMHVYIILPLFCYFGCSQSLLQHACFAAIYGILVP